eukprot:gene50851-45188_t
MPAPQRWEEHYDDKHQRPYWHNPSSGETVWTKPAGFGGGQVARYSGGGGGYSGSRLRCRGKSADHTGRVAQWNENGGFGFITPDGGGKDIFAHASGFGGCKGSNVQLIVPSRLEGVW